MMSASRLDMSHFNFPYNEDHANISIIAPKLFERPKDAQFGANTRGFKYKNHRYSETLWPTVVNDQTSDLLFNNFRGPTHIRRHSSQVDWTPIQHPLHSNFIPKESISAMILRLRCQ